MISHKCIKLFGVAGSGKTTTCCNIITRLIGCDGGEEVNNWFPHLLEKYSISDICFTSFTTAALESIREKILKSNKIHLSKEDANIDYFKTLNSLTWRLCGYNNEHKMKESEMIRFFKEKHISVRKGEDEVQSEMEEYLEVYHNIQTSTAKFLNELSDEEIRDCIKKQNVMMGDDTKLIEPISTCRILRDYHQWKTENGYKDYEDSIIKCVRDKIDVDCKVIIVDEAQDLTYVQTLLIDLWTRDYHKEMFIICGDDDQCVYQCFGASPEYFVNYTNDNVEKHFLQKTYRMPNNIANFCNNILKTISFREKKVVSSTINDGVLKYHSVDRHGFTQMFENTKDIEKQSTFILFRTNKIMNEIAGYIFEDTNVPFGFIREGTRGMWSYGFVCILNALNKLEKNLPLCQQEVFRLFSVLPTKTCVLHGAKKKIEKDGESVRIGPEHKYSAKEIIAMTVWSQNKLNEENTGIKNKILPFIEFSKTSKATIKDMQKSDDKNQMFRLKLKNADFIIDHVDYKHKTLVNKFNIKLGTYHSSKGLEADNVIVFLGTSYFFRKIDDAERRCFYVACSRAKKALHLVSSARFGHNSSLEDEFYHLIKQYCN